MRFNNIKVAYKIEDEHEPHNFECVCLREDLKVNNDNRFYIAINATCYKDGLSLSEAEREFMDYFNV